MSEMYHQDMINMKSKCVAKVPIFNHLELTEMQEILKVSRHLTFNKGEIIYHNGDPLEFMYIVHRGRVKVYKLFESGKEQLLRVLNPGEFMGELALFTERAMESYAEAIEKSEICAIHRNDIQKLLIQHPTISLKIMSEFSERLEETEHLVGQLSARDVETRVAGYLVTLSKDTNTHNIVLPMSKKDLASYLGTTQETISRRLSYFQANGWIEQVGHRNINILDMDALKQTAEES